MHLKPGVSLIGLQAPMVLASIIVAETYAEWGVTDVEITSGSDGEHRGQPVVGGIRDPHYEGKALDYGIHAVIPSARPTLITALEHRLGPEFVVLWENRGEDGEHVHVQHGSIHAI